MVHFERHSCHLLTEVKSRCPMTIMAPAETIKARRISAATKGLLVLNSNGDGFPRSSFAHNTVHRTLAARLDVAFC